MNVLHLSAVKIWGGGENHIVNLCRELEDLAPEVKNFILCKENSDFHLLLKNEDFEVISAPLAYKLDLRYVKKIISSCKKNSIDLIHIHDSTALALAVLADKFSDLPPFILSKKTSFPIRPRRRTLFKYNYSKIQKILCVSHFTKKIAAQSIVDPHRLQVIYHGTRFKNISRKSPFWIRSKYNLPKKAFLVGNIANHIEAKDLETLVRTAHELVNLKHRKDLFFIQIGNFSKLTGSLKNLVTEFSLEKHVLFTDYIPTASALIPQLDAMLITSEMEGIPQVIYESFYHGVPVVSTNVGGIPEVIDDKVNGLLSDPHDQIALAENLLFLMDNPQVIPNFAKISKERVEKHFTSQIMASKTLLEYKKATNGRLHGRTE
ncbi:glycosyltransferase family 4 protein [Salinimicrobium oceani]|uniref:Glycosyltransferase family 4 protein n=1 Tax=Salinimicrobium oceani TaxID=2722702 RepID=A0ABX1CTN1_9FLAO|nr:glycosyltransferase family 4 protein [Salinimicrobium oceani]NJW51648.1 glycosyltransferase family 4 protein [Salinimicrobium oceani]